MPTSSCAFVRRLPATAPFSGFIGIMNEDYATPQKGAKQELVDVLTSPLPKPSCNGVPEWARPAMDLLAKHKQTRPFIMATNCLGVDAPCFVAMVELKDP